jgi:phosphonate transport system substrate-binding protein
MRTLRPCTTCRRRLWAASLFALLLPFCQVGWAAEFTLAIHPLLPQQQTIEVYTPLAKHLQRVTGNPIRLVINKNLFAHWNATQREEYDLIIDGPHFTDYRLQKRQYHVLAKFPDVISYTLVTHSELLIFEPEELIGKRIATPPSPALGALRLFEIFPNPLRQPTIIPTDDAVIAAEKLSNGEVDAAMIPTFLVGRYREFNTVLTTEQVPAPAISASSKVPSAVREMIKEALLDLPNTPAGVKILESLRTPALVATTADEYKGYSSLLNGMWGI